LLYYDGLRDWSSMETLFERVKTVSREDVQRVAKKYLLVDNMGARLYTRKAEPEDPATADSMAQ